MTTTSLIRLPEVLRRIGVGRSTLYKLMGSGQFPEPVRFSRVLTWRDSDIQDWIDRQGEETAA